ncbi:MAG: carboxypeptidase regulatory-like domain-containing protein, partial [Polyangiaceae bacterium]|nr:carboxypeptidase regulatory-like domain-containing protein [Polyangiaceae bacterium]
PRAVIAGRVVDSKGAPVEGATVIARSTKALPPAFERDIRPDPSATSDDEGNFEIETTAGDRYHVTASRRGLAPGEALDIPSDTRDLTLTLSRGASLRGIVRDKATGAPVVAFTVNVLKIVGPIERREYQVASFFDAQGRYEITGLGTGSFSVIAAAHGYAASDEIPFSIQSDPPADPAPIDIPLGRGGRLTGSVVEENTNTNTNTNTKKPIAGARVSLEGRSNQSAGSAPLLVSTTTGEDGRFELSGLSAGLRSITVVAEGHHGRIVSGLAVAEGGDIGPITVELAKTEEGEEPRLELTGIGAVLSIKDDGLILGQVFPGGGAAEAGLQPGDIILRIDGLAVVDIGFEQAVQRIRGPEGSSVALFVKNAAGGEPTEIIVFRRRIRP